MRSSLWSERADRIMADGAWHNGPELMRELMRAVPPGVARRALEGHRVAVLLARDGLDDVSARSGEPRALVLHRLSAQYPRRFYVDDDALIARGQRKVARRLILNKTRAGGTWEFRGIENWPPTGEQWLRGTWQVRDRYARTYPVSDLATEYGVTTDTLRRVIDEYGVRVIRSGRVSRICEDDLPALDGAVEKYRQKQRAQKIRQLIENRQRRML